MFSYLLQALLGTLLLVIVYQLLTGAIATRGMLSSAGGREADPGRLQSLVVSMATIGSYAGTALVHGPELSLPEVPYLLLATFAGSQLLYLGNKAIRQFK